jgi:hypothetical protein
MTALQELEQTSLSIGHEEMEAHTTLVTTGGDTTPKKYLSKIWSSEAHAAMYQKIKAIHGKYNTGGFTSIDVPMSWPASHASQTTTTDQVLPNPKHATVWKTVDLRDEIFY